MKTISGKDVDILDLAEKIHEAAEWSFGDPDLQEIGSSDVSCAINSALEQMDLKNEDFDEKDYLLIRRMMNGSINCVRERFNGN